jgi:hypothetical protein
MTTKTQNVPPWKALHLIFVLWLFAAFLAIPVRAQEIHIRVLNGRNGKPITHECLNVSLGPWHGADLLAPTNKDGIVVLHMGGGTVSAEVPSGTRCVGGFPVRATLPQGEDRITIAGDYYVACREYRKVVPGEPVGPNTLKEVIPSYSIKKILESGVTAGNTCGKFRAEAKPGELIFFVRPLTWLERWRS